MDQNSTPSPKSPFEEGNIFDEFTQSQEVGSEVQKIQEREEKDLFYYLGKASTVLLSINILFFFLIVLSFGYNAIQKGESKTQYNFLKPICGLFLGNGEIAGDSCYSVSSMYMEYQKLVSEEKLSQVKTILPILGELYGIENFDASRKVEFLLDAEKSRMKPSNILNAFDALKYQFSPDDKTDIICSNMSITEKNLLTVECSIYSSDWDSKIVGLNGDTLSFLKTGGTSVSRATSFINFIENKQDSPFTIRERTKTFLLESADTPPYTKKTTINLVLEYKDLNTLSF